MAKLIDIQDKVPVLLPNAAFVALEHAVKTVQENTHRKIEYEVGDSKQDDFYPQFKTKHWDNECNFSARLVMGRGSVVEHDKKLGYEDVEKVARFYEKSTGDEDGGFEFDVVLKSKPTSNVLTWSLQHKGLDFFYQPELTPEEIASGAERDEHIVGSYAVYHKTKANNKVGSTEYRTGKAFHIYRPYAEDANGDRVWCDINIDATNNEMTVTVPQDFLDGATYPVIVDPTFGYTTAGASRVATSNRFNSLTNRVGSTFTLSEGGTLDSLHAYFDVRNVNESITGFIAINEADSGGSGVHAEIVLYSQSDSLQTTPAWFTHTAASEAISAGDYILNAAHDWEVANNITDVYFDSVTSDTYFEQFNTAGGNYAGSQEDPWTIAEGTVLTDNKLSIYVTYTATGGGGGVVTPVPTLALLGVG